MSTPIAAGTLSASTPAASRARLLRRWRRRLALLGESTPATVGVAIILMWTVLAVLAGGVGGQFRMGRYLQYNRQPHNNMPVDVAASPKVFTSV